MNAIARTLTIWVSGDAWPQADLHAYQQRSRTAIHRLTAVDATFRALAIISERAIPIAPFAASDMEEAIRKHAFNARHIQDYLFLSPQGELGPDSLSRSGFAISYGSYQEGSASVAPIEEGGIYLRLRGCSADAEPNANAVIQMSAIPTRSSALMRQLLQVLIETWQGRVGGIAISDHEAAVRGKSRSSYAGQWLYYLPFPHLATCLPPDIHHEPFANGILIQTTPHMPDANNPADVAAGIRIREVLDEFGLVNDATYAIEGWPPDREETIYEQFISGAPANRKYTVHCINFDGYDSDRKVLLYAKLFRRLKRHPKEWGLRGWDGPVLNEAKRQVRAAAKAGGVPIEWHIGLEEPAHQVRQLLSDYTDITGHQLRVIYTPLEEALNSSPPS